MDNQLFELLVSRFDKQDEMLARIEEKLDDHIGKDEGYWRKIDVQEGQIKLLKSMGAGLVAILGYVEWWLFRR